LKKYPLEIAVDCDNCKYERFCCKNVRAPLDEDEVEHYEYDPIMAERANIFVLARKGSGCTYLGEDGLCTIWDRRPRVCRRYDCSTDPKVQDWQNKKDALDKIRDEYKKSDKVRLVFSIGILPSDSAFKTTPMMVHQSDGMCAVEVIEMIDTPENIANGKADDLLLSIIKSKVAKELGK